MNNLEKVLEKIILKTVTGQYRKWCKKWLCCKNFYYLNPGWDFFGPTVKDTFIIHVYINFPQWKTQRPIWSKQKFSEQVNIQNKRNGKQVQQISVNILKKGTWIKWNTSTINAKTKKCCLGEVVNTERDEDNVPQIQLKYQQKYR